MTWNEESRRKRMDGAQGLEAVESEARAWIQPGSADDTGPERTRNDGNEEAGSRLAADR